MKLLSKNLILFLLVVFCKLGSLYGQATTSKFLELVIKTKNEALEPLSNVIVTVSEKDSSKPIVENNSPVNGTLTYKLDLFKEYIISFSHDDFITKNLWIDANVPGKENNTKVYFYFEEIVHMYNLASNKLEAELLGKSFAKLYYDVNRKDFFVNQDYAVSLKKEVGSFTPDQKAVRLKKLTLGRLSKGSTNTLIPVLPGKDDPGFELQGSAKKLLLKRGQVKPEQSDLTNAAISIYANSIKLTDLKTDNNGRFNTKLPFGYVYKIAIANSTTVSSFYTIDARIPQDKQSIRMVVFTDGIPCIDKKSTGVDTAKYRFAFDKYKYDGKKSLVRDDNYFEAFSNGKTPEYLDYKSNLKSKNAEQETTLPIGDPQKVEHISGKIILATPPREPIKNVKVVLVGDRGEPLQTCVLDNLGRFNFSNLILDQDYTLKVEGGNLQQAAGKKIAVLNSADKEVVVTSADEKGAFSFRLLASDKQAFSLLASDEETLMMITGNLLALINNATEPIANTKVQLVNDKGEMLEAVLTNDFGAFVFTKIPHDQNFLIELSEADPKLANLKVIITDRNGKEVNSAICNSSGKFKFQFLKQDELKLKTMEVEESELRLDLNGKLFKNSMQQALSNTKVDLLSKEDKVVQSTLTDDAGNFKFSSVNYGSGYTVSTSKNQAEKVILADANGVLVKEFKGGGSTAALKMNLSSSDLQKVAKVTLNDPWLVVSEKKGNTAKKETVVIPEKVYFELNDFKITNEARVILGKVIQVLKSGTSVKVEISSHTDSQGSDDYNKELSEKRAKSAVDYLVSKGIAKNRLTGVGYGETKLINKCVNGVECSEEEHAQNRRLEFKVMYD